MTPQQHSRLLLILLVLAFGTPFVAAVVLRFGGWEFWQTRNYGSLVMPPQDWNGLGLRSIDGQPYAFDPIGRRWQLLVLPPEPCLEPCRELADVLRRLWISEGRRADKLAVLWPGEWPQGIQRFPGLREIRLPKPLRAQLPVASDAEGKAAAALIDHNGFLVVTYAAGFDPSRMRRDLDRLVK
jgi:hypothetical protein